MAGPLRFAAATGFVAALFIAASAGHLAGQQAGSAGSAANPSPQSAAGGDARGPQGAPATNGPGTPGTPGTPAAPGAAPSSPQQPADAVTTQPPTFRAGVNFVRVDVIVTDRNGNPIDNLKPEEFEVTEDGKPQKIETFKLISLDGGLMGGQKDPPSVIRSDADEQIEARRDDVRLFGMFLDDYHVKRDSSLVMRQQLARFIETQIGPSDMVGLMSPLESLDAVRFGRNHDAMQRALQQFLGRKYDYRPMNDAESKYVYMATAEQIEQMRNQVSFTAIKALIMQMGSLKEGRKALILVSEGYSNILPPQIENPYGNNSGGAVAATGVGTSSLGDTREAFASMDINLDMQLIYDLANRNNVAIYTVDPRGLAGSEFGFDQPTVDQRTDSRYLTNTMDTLRALAEWTDGRAIVNRNDLAIAMKQIVMDSSAYYLIGYNSTLTTQDGKFHKIEVKLKRSGLQPPRYRRGYYAMKPAEAARMAASAARAAAPTPAPSAVEKAVTTTLTPRSRAIRTWIGTERGENGHTKVTFVWEPMPTRAGDVVRPADRPARVVLTAVNADGSPSFRGRVPESPMPASAGTMGSRVSFSVEPGTVQIRLSIEGPDANVVDTETREIAIPDLSSPQTSFATPELFRARSIPELQRLKTDPQPVPTAIREFTRTDRLLVRSVVYGPAGSTPTVTAALLNRAGQRLQDIPLAPAEAGSPMRQLDLVLATLNPGDYAIALSASSDGGDASELVAFRIVP